MLLADSREICLPNVYYWEQFTLKCIKILTVYSKAAIVYFYTYEQEMMKLGIEVYNERFFFLVSFVKFPEKKRKSTVFLLVMDLFEAIM